jgi:S-adenosylmethionine:tRNA ribosyltransferase-isomerase
VKLSEFDYELPEDRIAQHPAEPRDSARLLVHEVGRDATEHASVADLPGILRRGDLLVVNDTRVRPARLLGRRGSGGAVEVLVLGRAGAEARWRALVRPAKRLFSGETIELEQGSLLARACERLPGHDGRPGAEWIFEISEPGGGGRSVEDLLEIHGRMPLPPYIHRESGEDSQREADRSSYQTVFARVPGAVAAPTAGLHMTPGLLRRLDESGIARTEITLHVGLGTFQPVAVERIEDHAMHVEEFAVPEAAAQAVARARSTGGRVVAVGTTSARALETCRTPARGIQAGSGTTEIFITPGYSFGVVDALLTNFHLPRSTLLMLVSAMAGRERVLRLYREAIERGYRFYSYGDAMLLLP